MKTNNYSKIRLLISLIFAMILTIVPLPDLAGLFRPSWTLLFIFYIQFMIPGYFNIASILTIGLCLDVLLSTPMGAHAFALILTTWISSNKARRFVFFPIGQQLFFILLFSMIYELILLLIDAFLGFQIYPIKILGASFAGMLFWPWLRIFGETFLVHPYQKNPRHFIN